MARNTLEAVFGALGAGLTGFGRERQQRQEDEQRRRREADLMRVQMLNMGFDPEAEATRRSQGLAQAGRIAQAAPSTPFMPATSALGQALSQASQDLPRGRSITVGGERFVQPLSRMPETMAQRQREQTLADAAVARQQRLEDEAAAQAGRIAVVREQGRQTRLTQSERPTPTTGAGTGRMGLPALPTITRDAQELQKFTRDDISRLNSLNVYSAAQAPLLAAEAKDAFSAMLAGGGNVLADKEERQYAQYVGSISDAVARLSEAGVLTNQDIARFRAQTLFMPGDDIDTKMRKHSNLTSWAGWVVDARRLMSGDMTPEAMQSLRSAAGQIGQEAEPRTGGRASTAAQPGTTTAGGYTAADYQAALAALGADADADDVRAWLRTNRRR